MSSIKFQIEDSIYMNTNNILNNKLDSSIKSNKTSFNTSKTRKYLDNIKSKPILIREYLNTDIKKPSPQSKTTTNKDSSILSTDEMFNKFSSLMTNYQMSTNNTNSISLKRESISYWNNIRSSILSSNKLSSVIGQNNIMNELNETEIKNIRKILKANDHNKIPIQLKLTRHIHKPKQANIVVFNSVFNDPYNSLKCIKNNKHIYDSISNTAQELIDYRKDLNDKNINEKLKNSVENLSFVKIINNLYQKTTMINKSSDENTFNEKDNDIDSNTKGDIGSGQVSHNGLGITNSLNKNQNINDKKEKGQGMFYTLYNIYIYLYISYVIYSNY